MRIGREQRFTAADPCPACLRGRGNAWCYRLKTGTAVWCGRADVLGGRPGRPHGGGWIHDLATPGERNPLPPATPVTALPEPAAARPDFASLARRCVRALRPGQLEYLAGTLGLLPDVLRRLRVGWASAEALREAGTKYRRVRDRAEHDQGVFTFPMEDGAGHVVGIRTRTLTGEKFAVAGSDGSGLFVPHRPPLAPGGQILLPEGATSPAALLQMNFPAAGRPNCRAGVRQLRTLLAALKPSRVVLVGDNDERFNADRGVWEWPGRDGALATAAAVADLCGDVRVLMPPDGIKDSRAWVRAGAGVVDVWRAIEQAERVQEGASA